MTAARMGSRVGRAGPDDQADPDEQARRGDDIGPEMLAVALQRDRARLAAGADQDSAPDGIEHGRRAIERQALPGQRQRRGHPPAIPGMLQDRDAGDDDQHPLHHGGEELGLLVAVRMVGVGRAFGEAQGGQGNQRRGDVHGAFERIGEKGSTVREPPGTGFERKDTNAQHDAEARDLLRPLQRRELLFVSAACSKSIALRHPVACGAPWSCGPGSHRMYPLPQAVPITFGRPAVASFLRSLQMKMSIILLLDSLVSP